MIILDTNVLSAMMRADLEPVVEAWFDAQPVESVWTTAITVFEIRFGLSLLVQGRRRRRLERAFSSAIDDVLGGRVLNVDQMAAAAAATIAVDQRRAGQTVEIRDVLIAGIAAARKATLATRNVRHFQNANIALVDPWMI